MERGGTGRRRGLLSRIPWRGLLVLAILLTAVRVFFCTVLRVPSGSMEPAFHGDPARGDELLVFKPYYKLFSPERFDVVVFHRTGDDVKSEERVQLKRIAATAGETVRIEDGDLYVSPPGGRERRVQKPYREFRSLLVPLWREPFDATADTRLLSGHDHRTTYERGAVVLTGEPDAPNEVSLDLALDAVNFDDGWVDERNRPIPGSTSVKDVLFELELEADEPAVCLTFAFQSGGDHLSFGIVPKAPGHGLEVVRTVVADGTDYSSSTRFRQMLPGGGHTVEFWQIDGRAGFAVDGHVEFDEPLPGGAGVISRGTDVRGVSFKVSRASVRLTRFNVWRDLYYTDPDDASFGISGQAFHVPDGECFVLGDNSAASIDSRHFGAVPVGDLLGAPIFVIGPRPRWRWIH
jgi:signal peptidase I